MTMSIFETLLKTDKYGVYRRDNFLTLEMNSDPDSQLSVMTLDRPNDVCTAITRKMFLPMALIESPRDLVLIGVGGGMQAKFIHHYFPEFHLTALEIDLEVLQIARTFFGLPEDDERLKVMVGDGAEFMQQNRDQFDMILSDAYGDGNRFVDELHSLAFYSNCHRALRAGGIMIVNIYRPEPEWVQKFIASVSKTFHTCQFYPIEPFQGIMVLWKNFPEMGWKGVENRAAELDRRTGLGFAAFIDSFKTEKWIFGSSMADQMTK